MEEEKEPVVPVEPPKPLSTSEEVEESKVYLATHIQSVVDNLMTNI